ncbi:glycerophosphodiester phosphodiesterase [Sphingomonas aerophila]|uniref:glycerophosphodiester phosphodiesterase n=1 Tax=Sphingomonas aerophila TaxID=1344948 RepID=A0A7W9EVB0_9SPHN|nr:glycerophosphodiester phosphodiesterase [Sphingomonas aerophila]MBB5716076.1 glycerophosphoryl diester phosphodiesterase [Sphingomonas aerophila]
MRPEPLSPPILIAHRGASGERPEHTLAAYGLAIDQGADVIEPDLVPTRDGILVARHESEIGGTTDVADHPEFAARRTTKRISGHDVAGWFTEDFTLAELKTLRARERLPGLRPANTAHDGRYEVPTLAEVIDLAKRRSVEVGRTIAIYPETKHPTYFASIGLSTDEPLVRELQAAGWTTPDAPVFIQSFEVANLRRIAGLTHLRLVQLLNAHGGPADGAEGSYAAMATPTGLRQIASYAWGIGPHKGLLWHDDAPTTLVADAHDAGLRVHAWTYRAENAFLPPRFYRGDAPGDHGDLIGEINAALRLGIDGFFTDHPAQGAAALARKDLP